MSIALQCPKCSHFRGQITEADINDRTKNNVYICKKCKHTYTLEEGWQMMSNEPDMGNAQCPACGKPVTACGGKCLEVKKCANCPTTTPNARCMWKVINGKDYCQLCWDKVEPESKYPLHDRLTEREPQREAMQQFFDWLQDNGYCICEDSGSKYWPTHKRPDELIGGALGVCPKELEKEKQQMLDEIRAGN